MSGDENQKRFGLGKRPVKLDDNFVAPLDRATVEVSFRTQEPSLEDSVLLSSRPADTSQPGYDVLSPLRGFGRIALPNEYVESFRRRIEVPDDELLRDHVPDVPASYIIERAKEKASLEASLAAGADKITPTVEIARLLVHIGIDDDPDFLDAGAEAIHDITYVTIDGNTYALAYLQVEPSTSLVEPTYLKKLGDALKDVSDAPHRANLDLCFEFSDEGSARSINGQMVYFAFNEAVEDGDLPENFEVAVVTNKAGYVGPGKRDIDPEFALNVLGEKTFGYLKPKSGFLTGFKDFTIGTYDGSVDTLLSLTRKK